MIISNLNYMETVPEKNTVEGGFAQAQALTDAQAFGAAFAQTFIQSKTFTLSFAGNKQSVSQSNSLSIANV